MTQDERWQKQYDYVMEFLAKNHRNPSRHRLEEHDMLNWVKQQRKLKNKGDLKGRESGDVGNAIRYRFRKNGTKQNRP